MNIRWGIMGWLYMDIVDRSCVKRIMLRDLMMVSLGMVFHYVKIENTLAWKGVITHSALKYRLQFMNQHMVL